jgi:hypothetical protein
VGQGGGRGGDPDLDLVVGKVALGLLDPEGTCRWPRVMRHKEERSVWGWGHPAPLPLSPCLPQACAHQHHLSLRPGHHGLG